MIRKILLASAVSAVFASTAMADSLSIPPLGVVVRDGAAVNVNAGNVAPTLALQAIRKIDVSDIGGDVAVNNQSIGINADIEAAQKVDQVNVNVANSGLTGGGQLVGPINVKHVSGDVNASQTVVSANVSINLKK